MRRPLLGLVLLSVSSLLSFSIAGQPNSASVNFSTISQEDAEQCGMSISRPKMNDIYGKPLHFDCTTKERIRGNDYRVATMDFQYDPNRHHVSNSVTFYVGDLDLSQAARSLSSDFFYLDDGETIDQFSGKTIRHKDKTYCGLTVTTKVSPIRGSNWTGWIAEDAYSGSHLPNCESPEQYAPRYRCVSVILGNEKMSAAMNKVCLLRKREDNIQAGLSYDIFMEMTKSIRLNDGRIPTPRSTAAPSRASATPPATAAH